MSLLTILYLFFDLCSLIPMYKLEIVPVYAFVPKLLATTAHWSLLIALDQDQLEKFRNSAQQKWTPNYLALA
jgi:hypothetical protein